MAKERIYLTDITLHVREYRQTGNFSRVAEKGRMYSPVPENYTKNINTENHTIRFSMNLPPDLQARMDKGEIELMMPKDGLLVYPGTDVLEFTKSVKGKRILRKLAKEKRVGV